MFVVIVVSGATQLVNALFPVSATVTSIYVVILVYICDNYQKLEDRSDPDAKIYFLSGIVLFGAFFVSGVSTIWLLALRMDISSYKPLLAAYSLGLSFALLVLGNLLVGALVILTDLGKWSRRTTEWVRRKRRRSSSFTQLRRLAEWNLFIWLGSTILLFGALPRVLIWPSTSLILVSTTSIGITITAYGIIKRSKLAGLSVRQALIVILAVGAISVTTRLLGSISDSPILIIYLSLLVGILIGRRIS
jgi:hypothetical protein